VQNSLRTVVSNDPTMSSIISAHRFVTDSMAKHSLTEGTVWKQLYEKSIIQARKWMNSSRAVPQWLNQPISVLWKSDKSWNEGRISEIQDGQINVTYMEDYSELLNVDSNLQFRFEKMKPEEWWIGEKLDVKWDGKYEWYEGIIESLDSGKVNVRYLDNSAESLDLEKHVHYFSMDRSADVFQMTTKLFEDLLKPPALKIAPEFLKTGSVSEKKDEEEVLGSNPTSLSTDYTPKVKEEPLEPITIQEFPAPIKVEEEPRRKTRSYTLSHEARMRQHLMSETTQTLKYDLKHYISAEHALNLQREFYDQGIIVEEEDRLQKHGRLFLACKITCLPCKTLNEDNVYFAQGLMTIKNSALSLKNHCFPTPSVKFRKHAKNLQHWLDKDRPGLTDRVSIIDQEIEETLKRQLKK